MTLRCECGGALEIEQQSYGEKHAYEQYRCASCGRTGGYSFGNGPDMMTGCVVSVDDF